MKGWGAWFGDNKRSAGIENLKCQSEKLNENTVIEIEIDKAGL